MLSSSSSFTNAHLRSVGRYAQLALFISRLWCLKKMFCLNDHRPRVYSISLKILYNIVMFYWSREEKYSELVWSLSTLSQHNKCCATVFIIYWSLCMLSGTGYYKAHVRVGCFDRCFSIILFYTKRVCARSPVKARTLKSLWMRVDCGCDNERNENARFAAL